MVTIDEFLNVDLRVGKILEVDDLPTRKPMYRLKIDLGELGIRNVAAGIKSFYAKEELMGKKVIVVANLDPKPIGEFVSEGMVLAAEENGNITLLTTDKDLAPGSRVR